MVAMVDVFWDETDHEHARLASTMASKSDARSIFWRRRLGLKGYCSVMAWNGWNGWNGWKGWKTRRFHEIALIVQNGSSNSKWNQLINLSTLKFDEAMNQWHSSQELIQRMNLEAESRKGIATKPGCQVGAWSEWLLRSWWFFWMPHFPPLKLRDKMG